MSTVYTLQFVKSVIHSVAFTKKLREKLADDRLALEPELTGLYQSLLTLMEAVHNSKDDQPELNYLKGELAF